ncbi:unnamed protein product [Rotaria magnacalcarata]|uniref:P2X purinoceptor n=2 Tax=Rotaria magnacalcarata TaxID=392030 RepID=A0A8S2R9U2_9BILA|nr:unnamed protein product [Rotaria magnacalcarata]
MSTRDSSAKVHCVPLREYCSFSNVKSMVRGFVYEYETPKIVTIHSISIALMCRLIQLLILIYGIIYLMIHKKGYQETDTSIISSITLKVKGIGYNQTGQNQTLVIDGADYIVPPQENNALFLMTNFIRTDQEHGKCPESPDEKMSSCTGNDYCLANQNFQKANGKWTGICLIKNNSFVNASETTKGRCELEGWCPVENDRNIPFPIRDALNFTIFVKNFIEFPRFKVIRKNIQEDAAYLKRCHYDQGEHKGCPIFRVGTLLDIVESDPFEQLQMLKLGGVIRLKIHWDCNLDKSSSLCKPEYSFGRLDGPYKEQSFSHGFNFRFASHWKHQNRSYRTLTKAFGLRFIISVSGQAGRFDVITLTLNIGSLIGILGLATFICDIVALYVHRQSDVYRQQKFQDVDLHFQQVEGLKPLPTDSSTDQARRTYLDHIDGTVLNNHATDDGDATQNAETAPKTEFQLEEVNYHSLYDNLQPTTKEISQQLTPRAAFANIQRQKTGSTSSNTSSLLSSIKQKYSTKHSQLPYLSSEENQLYDKSNIVFVDEDTPELSERNELHQRTDGNQQFSNSSSTNHGLSVRPTSTVETLL